MILKCKADHVTSLIKALLIAYISHSIKSKIIILTPEPSITFSTWSDFESFSLYLSGLVILAWNTSSPFPYSGFCNLLICLRCTFLDLHRAHLVLAFTLHCKYHLLGEIILSCPIFGTYQYFLLFATDQHSLEYKFHEARILSILFTVEFLVPNMEFDT
jgi:hypothetical protein